MLVGVHLQRLWILYEQKDMVDYMDCEWLLQSLPVFELDLMIFFVKNHLFW